MPFELEHIVPWGRNLEEYKLMFSLDEYDLDRNIISFGDGPASFNFEATSLDKSITSLDPIYQFSKNEIENRIQETKDVVMKQVCKNKEQFVWGTIKTPEELKTVRLSAMNNFLFDFEIGKKEFRYIAHELPKRTSFKDKKFDIGLSSHFLFLYDELGINFHIDSLKEMLRICKEVRIFPIVNLNTKKPRFFDEIIKEFQSDYNFNTKDTNYEFQRGGNQMLQITLK